MRKPHTNSIRYSIILLLCFFVLGGQPVEFGQENTFFHGFLIQNPVIRIGLGVNLSDIQIASSSGMKIYEINSHYKLVAEDVQEAWIKGRKEKLTEKFVIQVAQSKDREEAEIFAQELRSKSERKVYVTQGGEETLEGTFQVKIGDFLTRGDALSYIVKLNKMGIDDTWILKEEITEEESKPIWILVNDELKSLHDETVLYFIPSNPQSYLSFNRRDYRGLFILRATRKGLVLVNVLNIEDYIKAVVPSELSPYNFRQIEAHKAQAVAARTYATPAELDAAAAAVPGLAWLELPRNPIYWGRDELGLPVLLWITEPTREVLPFLQCFAHCTPFELAYLLPQDRDKTVTVRPSGDGWTPCLEWAR